MPTDRRATACVAWLVAALGCGPRYRPEGPPAEPGPVARLDRPRPAATSGRQLVVGEMCPAAAAGRPAVTPLVMRKGSWIDSTAELANAIERGAVPRFAVFGVDGKIAGAFDTLGLADIGLQQTVASGTYVGAMPCTSDGGGGTRVEDPKCGPFTGGCGLAVGPLSRADEPAAVPAFQTGGACVQGDALAVDIDGDKKMESFAFTGVLDGARSPANEWTAAPPGAAPTCKPTFHVYDVRLTPPPDGKPFTDKHVVGLDVLGVVDLDGDGRKELVIALRFPTIRTIAVYTAAQSAQRLELAGESQAANSVGSPR